MTGDELTPAAVHAVWTELDRYATYTDNREEPVPLSLGEAVMQTSLAVPVGLGTFVALTRLTQLPYGWLMSVIAGTAVVSLALIARVRVGGRELIRALLAGAAAGAGALVALWLGVFVWAAITRTPVA